ncbi:organic solute transporter ostalpha protein [Perilla frutescens var. hirtella]|nr:organic solute transporter ostalpha protein [Perilla frutescens var. frutescens]KAH6792878.1 organic solute transporter ostalpha protein [Perilla frutescens var. hirtella]
MDFANMDRRQLTLAGAGFSVMLTLHYSFQLLSQHMFYWKNPKEQRAILIIILMAPVYAVNSFFGLVDARGGKPFFMLLDSVKECYEALAIATFLALMYSYLNISMSRNVVPDEIKGREIHLSFPMTLFLGVLLDILVATGIIRSYHFWLDTEHVEEAIQNVLVCVEMVIFAVLQQYAYHVAPYSGDIEAKLKLQKRHD